MIAKITHGRSAARALAYDHGPGRADEHHDPRKVAGNIPGGDWQLRAHHMQRFVDSHKQDRGDRNVYRVALANPETDRVLSDQEWKSIAEKFVARFGAGQSMWEATRHDRHHIHLTISKDRFDGSRMSTSNDYRRAAAICRELERDHGLTNAAEKTGRGSGRVRGDLEATARGNPQPDRDWLRSTISRVLNRGGGIDELRVAGVDVKLNTATTGRVSGISYARAQREGNENTANGTVGEQRWFKGSTLGKAYGWNQVNDAFRDAASQNRPNGATPTVDSPHRREEPPHLALELKTLSLSQRRAEALEAALSRAAKRGQRRSNDRDHGR